jgi:hypothetical protein
MATKAKGKGQKAKSAAKAPRKAAPRKPAPKRRDPAKVERFVEEAARPGVTQGEAATRAGFTDNPASAKVQGSILMSDPDIRARVQMRRAEALRRAQVETDEIIGGLAEIATASLADVLLPDGTFDFSACVERGTDHLLKELETTETFDKEGNRTVRHRFKMYDRLNAYNQLRDTFGMKEEPRPNSLGDRRRREVEQMLDQICLSENVERPAAAAMLIEGLRVLPNTEEQIKLVSEYAN